ncbi:hypothetical protein E2C01_067216 [Portunus trituberculatus]|uniref:Uncharacterized protein n=1 Tax=Portunus trituberculatus TaxID=210409 RepID=A0A5B7HWW1_PORTR|nr:hypothetical protein [Portunus trituberculatus]
MSSIVLRRESLEPRRIREVVEIVDAAVSRKLCFLRLGLEVAACGIIEAARWRPCLPLVRSQLDLPWALPRVPGAVGMHSVIWRGLVLPLVFRAMVVYGKFASCRAMGRMGLPV